MAQKAERDEEARNELETYKEKFGLGDVPELKGEALRAYQLFGVFHTQRTHDFPMAFAMKMQDIEIDVDSPEWASFFHRAWDDIYLTIKEVQEKKRKRREES